MIYYVARRLDAMTVTSRTTDEAIYYFVLYNIYLWMYNVLNHTIMYI